MTRCDFFSLVWRLQLIEEVKVKLFKADKRWRNKIIKKKSVGKTNCHFDG